MIKTCPFCGHQPDIEDPDTCHPSGTGWKDRDDGFRSYHRSTEVPRDQWCYVLHCSTTAGGCGVEITGDSRQEAIDKWNARV